MKAEILAQLDERPRIGVLPDGTLMGFHVSREETPREVRARTSSDSGRTWSAAETVLTLPESVSPQQVGPPPRIPGREPSAGSAPVGIDDDSADDDPIGEWGGCEALVDVDGEIHLFLLNDRATGVLRNPAGEGEVQRMSLYERRLDIWHARTQGGRLEIGRWHALELRWDCAAGTCQVRVDGEAVGALPLQRASDGANYLRLRSSSETGEHGGVLVEQVDVEVEAANGTRTQ